jgi:hypothetical protein
VAFVFGGDGLSEPPGGRAAGFLALSPRRIEVRRLDPAKSILSVVRHLSAGSYLQFRSVQDDVPRGPPA